MKKNWLKWACFIISMAKYNDLIKGSNRTAMSI